MQVIFFGSEDVDNLLANMTSGELDRIPFGVIKVDEPGRIVIFNTAEGSITGVDPATAIGKNFFTDIAPCANTPTFRGRFDSGVREGALNVLFEWRLATQSRPLVQVHMKQAREPDRYWIFTKRL
ncbi:MAG TPA: photoactive yellow protein [Rhodopila sp.]|nr:photoactive yellow protein [Rhodopila sp.]